jgi:hypothetical protein
MAEPPTPSGFWARHATAWRHRAALAALFLVVCWAYRPALHHLPREDQWSFLLDTVHEDRFLPLLAQTYSYNRTREIGPGDYPLFRPGLFALLSAEKALFGARYQFWHAVGIALHWAVVWLFLRLLLRLDRLYPAGSAAAGRLRTPLAYVLALFFAVNFHNTEMVIWCHIHGYMLYTLLVLGGLLLLLDELCGAPPARGRRWRLGGAFALTLLAAFTYETGAAYAVCLGAVLALVWAARRRVRHGLLLFALFAAILPVNRAVDWLDRLSHPETQPDITEATVLEKAQWELTVAHAKRYVLFTLWQPFFPSCPEWGFKERLWIAEPGTNPQAYWRREPTLLASYAAVLAGAGLAAWQLARIMARRRLLAGSLFLLLPACLILLHLGIIVFGRMNLRPFPWVLAINTYYTYTPLLALLIVLYYLWVRVPTPPARAAPVVLAVLLGGLGVLACFSARKVHAMTTQIENYYGPLYRQVKCVQRLIDRHRHDPGFAISFDPPVFYSLDNIHGVSRLETLFCRYFDHERPTHVICQDGRRWCVLGEEEYRRRCGGPRYRELPTFVRAGTTYMLSRHGRRYYGLPFEEGRYLPNRRDYRRLLEGDSVEDVLRLVPALPPAR